MEIDEIDISHWKRYAKDQSIVAIVGTGASYFSNLTITKNKRIHINDHINKRSLAYDTSTSKDGRHQDNLTSSDIANVIDKISNEFSDDHADMDFGSLGLISQITGIKTFISFARDGLLEMALIKHRGKPYPKTINYFHNYESFSGRYEDLKNQIQPNDTCIIYLLGKYGLTNIKYADGHYDRVVHYEDDAADLIALFSNEMGLKGSTPNSGGFSQFLYEKLAGKNILGIGMNNSHWETLNYILALAPKVDARNTKRLLFTSNFELKNDYNELFYKHRLSTTIIPDSPDSFLSELIPVMPFNPSLDANVFICYLRSSRGLCKELTKKLQEYGVNYWVDESMKSEDIVKKTISEKMNQCSHFLLLISKDMVEIDKSDNISEYPYSLRTEWLILMHFLLKKEKKKVIPIFDQALRIRERAQEIFEKIVGLSFIGDPMESARKELLNLKNNWTTHLGFEVNDLLHDNSKMKELISSLNSKND